IPSQEPTENASNSASADRASADRASADRASADRASADPAADPRGPTTAQVALGVLIVGQLLFILVANTLNGLTNIRRITGDNEDVGGVVDQATGGLTSARGHWYNFYRIVNHGEETMNIGQNWRLFSPFVSDGSTLLSVELRWDDLPPGAAAIPGTRAPVVLLSANEPENLERYVRLGPWRLRRYESYFAP